MKIESDRDLPIQEIEQYNLFTKVKRIPFGGDIHMFMPTFKVNTKMDAGRAVKNLGARKLFTAAAELENLSQSGPLSVNNIVHSAVVEVTKEGTEGAAATGVGIVLLSADFGETKKVLVDRPFIFVVKDKTNNIPLLVGRVKDPTK